MKKFIEGTKTAWLVLLGFLFCGVVAFSAYAIGDHVLERTIGRCNGSPTAYTCNEVTDMPVCTCDNGYHFFWQPDPTNKTK